MPNDDNVLPLNALPILYYAVAGALDASKEQLHNLLQAENKPYVLDDELVNSIIRSYAKQNKTIMHEKAWCSAWLKMKLTTEQRKTIDEIKNNLLEMEKINQRILFLAEHFKEHTIDKISKMDEVELVVF